MLIVGYGNPLRGDDGAGRVAAERLGGVSVHQLTPELAERIAAADTVIFLDADVNLPPGEISVKRLAGAAAQLDHHAGPEGLLHLARMVYGKEPKAFLIGMGGENFDLREGLSAAAEHSVELALKTVRNL